MKATGIFAYRLVRGKLPVVPTQKEKFGFPTLVRIREIRNKSRRPFVTHKAPNPQWSGYICQLIKEKELVDSQLESLSLATFQRTWRPIVRRQAFGFNWLRANPRWWRSPLSPKDDDSKKSSPLEDIRTQNEVPTSNATLNLAAKPTRIKETPFYSPTTQKNG